MSLLSLIAASQATAGPLVDESALTVRRQVATHCTWWRTSTGTGATPVTLVTNHTITADAKDLVLRFGVHGWAGADDGLTGQTWVVHRGEVRQVTWGGQGIFRVPRLEFVDSDPVRITVAAGDLVQVVTEYPKNAVYPKGEMRWDTPTRGIAYGAFQQVPTVTEGNTSGSPVLITGLTAPTTVAVACLGDSILESGWVRRATHSLGFAWADLSQWAEGVPTERLGGRLSPSDSQIFTLGFCEYGTNNRRDKNIEQSLLNEWEWLRNGPCQSLVQTTMTPYTSGDFKTLDGQTVAESDRVFRERVNGWLRDGAPLDGGAPAPTGTSSPTAIRAGSAGHPLAAICDVAAAVEKANVRGELVWDTRAGQATSDGVHPTRVGADLMEPVAREWIAKALSKPAPSNQA